MMRHVWAALAGANFGVALAVWWQHGLNAEVVIFAALGVAFVVARGRRAEGAIE